MDRSKLLAIAALLLLALPLIGVIIVSNTAGSITPNDQVFKRSISGTPTIDVASWQLRVDGVVEHPLILNYSQILSLPNVTITAVIKCPSGGSANVVWKGVPFKVIIQMVAPKVGAREAVSYGADGYSSSLTLDEITDHVLMAYGMNGVPLPADQGYPLRVVAPENYGYKWVKWITHIEIVDYDYQGYWESRGWNDSAQMAAVGEWSIHAYLLSISFILCGVALASGYGAAVRGGFWSAIPAFRDRRFHVTSSVVFLAVFVSAFIYWAFTTYSDRGGLFYTVHGIMSGLLVALFVFGGVVGMGRFSKGDRGSSHRSINVFSFFLYVIVMAIGLMMAAGVF
jgi:hypothetical protein